MSQLARSLVGAVSLAVFLVSSASPAAVAQAANDPTEAWRRELLRIGRQISAEEFEAAESAAIELAGEMADQIVGGAGAAMPLAMVTTYRALAVAGQGRRAEAIWHWQVAQQLFPQVSEIDLAAFGPVGGFLAVHPPRADPHRRPLDRTGEVEAGFVPPRRLESPLPDFPDGRAFRGLTVDVVVQVVVGVDGLPRQPLILRTNGEPTLVWATLEALREWRFEPARRGGEPEPALYRLTASFVVPSD